MVRILLDFLLAAGGVGRGGRGLHRFSLPELADPNAPLGVQEVFVRNKLMQQMQAMCTEETIWISRRRRVPGWQVERPG